MDTRLKRIIERYTKNLKRELKVRNISLNDYITVAGICYKALFPERKELSDLEVYKTFVGSKHGGMLNIKNKNNPEEFKEWYESKKWRDSNPFQIHQSAIFLYPPTKDYPYYRLILKDEAFREDFIKIVEALIKYEVAFRVL